MKSTGELQRPVRFASLNSRGKAAWLCLLLTIALGRISVGQNIPKWFPKAPPLPPPSGEVIRVSTAEELLAAVDRLLPGGTILLADGRYRLPRPIILDQKQNIALRSASGDAIQVTLSGKGWEQGDEHDDIVHIGRCDGVTIADLSFTDCRSYGIKVEAEHAPTDIQILNCRFRDIGVRAIKGSAAQDASVRAVKGSVRGCYFENTKVPPAEWLFGGDYIAAIDMMALEDWTFSDNVFRNIKGHNGGGRAAIFLWVRSKNILVERNLMVDCDRGVAFGNPGASTANLAGAPLVYVSDSIIRNNFITGGPDCGMELWYSDRVKILNNTIWRPEQNWNRGIRIGTGTTNTEVANNLVHGGIQLDGGKAAVHDNLSGRLEGYFEDPSAGALMLTKAAKGALGRAMPMPEVTEDIRGRARSGTPDLGAWESEKDPKLTGDYLGTIQFGTRTATIKKLEVLPYVRSEYSELYRFDTFSNPKLKELRQRYQLDQVIGPGRDEFERQELLLDWVHHRFKNFGRPSVETTDALQILKGIEEGQSYFCVQYAHLYASAAASLGWVDRELALRRHQDSPDGGSTEHLTTEMWSNQYRKWIMMDPTANMHLEKDGVPLNGFEIRQEWFYHGGTNLVFVVGKERKHYRKTDLPIFLGRFAGFGDLTVPADELCKYGFIGYIPNTDLMDSDPDYGRMFIVKDKLCEGTQWHNRRNPVNPAVDPYFPINQAAVSLASEQDRVRVTLQTLTPNFKTYQARIDDGDWAPVDSSLLWNVHAGSNRLELRTVNQFGVEGSVSTVEVEL
jgi:hypothetical protein